MTSQILSDHNGSGQLKWSFSDADDDFDFLSKNQTLVLTYDITVSDNHGGTVKQTVTVTITGTDDKPVINAAAAHGDRTGQPDAVVVAGYGACRAQFHRCRSRQHRTYRQRDLGFGIRRRPAGFCPVAFGTAELMSFLNVDNVVKASGSSSGTINTTFSAPDLAFDYLAAGEHLQITYVVQLDDHAGGVSTQNVVVTVIGTNDKPVYLSGPESAHLTEGQHVSPAGNLTAQGDLFFTDVDLSDTHTVSTTVSAALSGGGSIPLSNAALLAAFATSLEDSTGHVLGEVDWNFALPNNLTNFLGGGQTLTLTYHVAVNDHAGRTGDPGCHRDDPRHQPPGHDHQRSGIGRGGGACRHHRLGRHRHHDDGAGRNAEFFRCRYRRHPHRRGVARLPRPGRAARASRRRRRRILRRR